MSRVPEREPRWQFTLTGMFWAVGALGVYLGLCMLAARDPWVAPWRVLLAAAVAVGILARTIVLCRQTSSRRIALGQSLLHVAVCLYVPSTWIVLRTYWSSYHLFWLKLWPILPGLVPGFWLFHPEDAVEFAAMGVVTAALLIGLEWLGARGRWGIVAATTIALAVSVPSSLLAYAMFRA